MTNFNIDTERIFEELKNTYAFVNLDGGQKAVAMRCPNPSGYEHDIYLLSIRKFLNSLPWKSLERRGLGRRWLKWDGKTVFEGLTFDREGHNDSGKLNLFSGLRLSPVKGSCELFESFLRSGSAGNDKVVSWLCQAIKGTVNDQVLVLRTDCESEFCHSDYEYCLSRVLREIFGGYYRKISDDDMNVDDILKGSTKVPVVVNVSADFAFNTTAGRHLVNYLLNSPTLKMWWNKWPVVEVPNCANLIIRAPKDWSLDDVPDTSRYVVVDVKWEDDNSYKFNSHYNEEGTAEISAFMHKYL